MLQEEIKPCFTKLSPIFSSHLCLQYLFSITSYKECKCYSFFPFEKLSTTRFTVSRIIHCIWVSEGGELRGTHEHEWNVSPFFWEHQYLRFFDVRSNTVTKKLMWYLSYTSQLLPYLLSCPGQSRAGLSSPLLPPAHRYFFHLSFRKNWAMDDTSWFSVDSNKHPHF